jgi:hypothetical protein
MSLWKVVERTEEYAEVESIETLEQKNRSMGLSDYFILGTLLLNLEILYRHCTIISLCVWLRQ